MAKFRARDEIDLAVALHDAELLGRTCCSERGLTTLELRVALRWLPRDGWQWQ